VENSDILIGNPYLEQFSTLHSDKLQGRNKWDQLVHCMNHQSTPPWKPRYPKIKKIKSYHNTRLVQLNIRKQVNHCQTSGVPRTQSRMWSQAELAADSALESFLALMIAAPRCWTVVMNSAFNLQPRNRINIVIHTFPNQIKQTFKTYTIINTTRRP